MIISHFYLFLLFIALVTITGCASQTIQITPNENEPVREERSKYGVTCHGSNLYDFHWRGPSGIISQSPQFRWVAIYPLKKYYYYTTQQYQSYLFIHVVFLFPRENIAYFFGAFLIYWVGRYYYTLFMYTQFLRVFNIDDFKRKKLQFIQNKM